MQSICAGEVSGPVLRDARMFDPAGLALVPRIRQRAELSAARLIRLTLGNRPGDLPRCRALRIAHQNRAEKGALCCKQVYRPKKKASRNCLLQQAL